MVKNKIVSRIKFRSYIVKFIAFIIFLIFLCSIFASCDQYQKIKSSIVQKFTDEEEIGSAVRVVENFFNALINKDYSRAYEYICSEDKENRKLEDFNDELSNVTEIVSIEINWVEIKNNIAIVGIDLIDLYDGEEKVYKNIEVSLMKAEDGSWKINFWN